MKFILVMDTLRYILKGKRGIRPLNFSLIFQKHNKGY